MGKRIKTTMLEFCKTILSKVSFEPTLFKKELNKALKTLKREEKVNLYEWCLENFQGIQLQISDKLFRKNLPEPIYIKVHDHHPLRR